MRLAWLSEKKEGNKVLCLACSQRCILKEDEYGKCGVRINKNGKLYLTVYGKVSAYHVDPVEKKPLYHFLPGTYTFSIGTVGCNFTCKFCQNWEISQFPQTHGYRVFGYDMPPEEVVRLAKLYRCESISYTYNEPIIFAEYAYDVMKLAKEEGLLNVFVSSGYETEYALDILAEYLSAMNIDLKSFSDKFYREVCGARLKGVLKGIEQAYKKGIWIEITTLIIPGLNDSEEEIRDIARFIASLSKDIPWHISRFFPAYLMTDRPPTPPHKLMKAYQIGKEEGLKYVYIGNYPSPEHMATYCPSCNFKVIDRAGYLGETVINHLRNGRCPSCNASVAGVWETCPGGLEPPT